MKLSELYKKAISTAIGNDPRGKDVVLQERECAGKKFDEMKTKEKDLFDREALDNP